MNTLETGIFLTFWDDILQRTNATSKKLQSTKLDINTAVDSLKNLKQYISDKRNDFKKFEEKGKVLSGQDTYQEIRQSRRKDDIGSLSKRFEVQSYLPVIDAFISSIDKRSKCYEKIAKKFGVLRNILTLKRWEIEEAAKKLREAYPHDLDEYIVGEMVHFSHFIRPFQKDEPEDISFEQYCYNLLFEKDVKDTFPNVEIVLRMYLSLMVSNCSGERSFSKMKIIQNRLRTAMEQERLTNLVLMSMESDILREVDCADLINTFALVKSRKMPRN